MIGSYRSLLAALWLGAAAATPALAERQDQGTFDLAIRGIRAGVLSFSGSNDGTSYSAVGRLESTGIVAAIRKVRYDASASGRMAKGKWSPARYEEQADTGKRQSASLLEYRDGIPRELLKASREGTPQYIDPATQAGTVDPMTALYATLRDVPAAEACRLSLMMFDGARRSQITLSSPEVAGDTIACTGEYRRLAGFSEKEMAEKQRFAFRLSYASADPGHVRVVSVTMDTLYGRATLTRR